MRLEKEEGKKAYREDQLFSPEKRSGLHCNPTRFGVCTAERG